MQGGTPATHASPAAACFERAQALFNEKNYEYAHVMLSQCVLGDAGNLEFVDALLRNLRKLEPKDRRRWSLASRRSREFRKANQAKQWKEVLKLGVERLKANPWDVSVLRVLAEASAACHFNEVELAYLKQALDAKPFDAEVNRHCARSLSRMGQFDQAIACWHRVEEIRRGDKEAPRMIALLVEERLKYPDGKPPVSPGPVKAPSTVVAASEQSDPLLPTPRQALALAIEQDPSDRSNYLRLADLLCDDELFSEAEKTVQAGLTVCGKHKDLVAKLCEVRSLHDNRLRNRAESHVATKHNEPLFPPWMQSLRPSGLGTGLVAAGAALAMQLHPPLAVAIWEMIDVRNWSRLVWFSANGVILGLLLVVRFGPEMYHRWRSE